MLKFRFIGMFVRRRVSPKRRFDSARMSDDSKLISFSKALNSEAWAEPSEAEVGYEPIGAPLKDTQISVKLEASFSGDAKNLAFLLASTLVSLMVDYAVVARDSTLILGKVASRANESELVRLQISMAHSNGVSTYGGKKFSSAHEAFVVSLEKAWKYLKGRKNVVADTEAVFGTAPKSVAAFNAAVGGKFGKEKTLVKGKPKQIVIDDGIKPMIDALLLIDNPKGTRTAAFEESSVFNIYRWAIIGFVHYVDGNAKKAYGAFDNAFEAAAAVTGFE
jgi:hypothetical protein